jgi:23S rRNA-/tRNA-specific pseudouridylate synthase
VGDPIYKREMKNIHPIELDRLFLHATDLTIQLPSGVETTFHAPLPEELEQVLASLSRNV